MDHLYDFSCCTFVFFYCVNKAVVHVQFSSTRTHLFVHEDVDEGVDDGAALRQQRRHHAGHRADDVGGSECCHHGHHAVRHPAEQVAGRRGQNHEQYVVLPLPGCSLPDLTHLRMHMSLFI